MKLQGSVLEKDNFIEQRATEVIRSLDHLSLDWGRGRCYPDALSYVVLSSGFRAYVLLAFGSGQVVPVCLQLDQLHASKRSMDKILEHKQTELDNGYLRVTAALVRFTASSKINNNQPISKFNMLSQL